MNIAGHFLWYMCASSCSIKLNSSNVLLHCSFIFYIIFFITSCSILFDLPYFLGVVHRDIKPSNILITAEGEIKLSDFGISKMLYPPSTTTCSSENTTKPNEMKYSRNYTPKEGFNSKWEFKSDVWSLGISIFEVHTGAWPFPRDLPCPFIHLFYNPIDYSEFDPTLADFMQHCIVINSASRWDVKQLLSHPLMKDGKKVIEEVQGNHTYAVQMCLLCSCF